MFDLINETENTDAEARIAELQDAKEHLGTARTWYNSAATRVNTIIAETQNGSAAAEVIYDDLDNQPISILDRLEKIILDAKRPLHITAIAKEAGKRGIAFSGDPDKPIKNKIRSSMNGSKRFVNLGSNTWWITGVPVPGDEPPKA